MTLPMPDEKPIPDPNEQANNFERDVLYLLTDPYDNQPLWSVEDIGREMEHADRAEVAVRGLLCAGLIHRTSDGFVFATRAAVRHVQMVGHGVI
jgi:hypothetical protein